MTYPIANIYGSSASSGDNTIINGDFDIWQRGTSFAPIANGDFSADRFRYASIGTGVVTASQSSVVPTQAEAGHLSNYSLKLDVTTADSSLAASDQYSQRYNIEGYDYKQFEGNTGTLSFWVRSAKTGIHCVSFRNSVADRSYVAEYTITVANTWEKQVITVPFDYTGGTWNYTTGIGLLITICLGIGSNFYTTTTDSWQTGNFQSTSSQVNVMDTIGNTFYLSQIKFELGSVATPFSTAGATYKEELAMCQRYAREVYVSARFPAGGVTEILDTSIDWVIMRATPTVTLVSGGSANRASSAMLYAGSSFGGRFELVSSSAGDCYTIGSTYLLTSEL